MENQQESFRDSLINVVGSVKSELSYKPDVDRQLEVLAALPEDFMERISDFIVEQRREQRFYDEKRHKIPEPENLEKIVSGKVFELICEYDNELNQSSDAGQLLIDMMHNPHDTGLPERFYHKRNPDIASIATNKKGDLVIRSVGEAKLGKLDIRCYEQLEKNGIRTTVRELVDYLNSEESDALGIPWLIQLKADGHKVVLSNQFKQRLIIPAAVDTHKTSLFVDHQKFKFEGRTADMAKLTTTILPKETDVVNSAFSHAEVMAITSFVIDSLSQESQEGQIDSIITEPLEEMDGNDRYSNPVSIALPIDDVVAKCIKMTFNPDKNIKDRAEYDLVRGQIDSLTPQDVIAIWFLDLGFEHISKNNIKGMEKQLNGTPEGEALAQISKLYQMAISEENTTPIKLLEESVTDPLLHIAINNLKIDPSMRRFITEERIKQLAALQFAKDNFQILLGKE